MLRKRGDYDDPRVHFAVNCASIGCPALREEAFVAERLDAAAGRADAALHERPHAQPLQRAAWRLELSKIFDWYGEDFRPSPAAWLAAQARWLTEDPAQQAAIAAQRLPLRFLDYDWRLNDRL
jgi:hypothetical protein